MKVVLVIMTGIGFTLGVVLGLLLHLPTDSLPAEHSQLLSSNTRLKRSVKTLDINLDLANGPPSVFEDLNNAYDVIDDPSRHSSSSSSTYSSIKEDRKSSNKARRRSNSSSDSANKGSAHASDVVAQQRLPQVNKHTSDDKRHRHLSGDVNSGRHRDGRHLVFDEKLALKPTLGINGLYDANKGTSDDEMSGPKRTQSPEDKMYLQSLVRGVLWTDRLEQSCPRAFSSSETDSWRRKSDSLDVVKMEEGCGRMQNRLLTFRDASKACARYRLNTDQIQGEIFSYYLAKLLNISNLPPTSLALVNSVERKWRTVHLDLSLAQWADSKLVVLTQYIDGLQAAHIPPDFREEHRKLHPILQHLGTKNPSELCELVQWSDLIVFDYLTANLDRVINNMFNRQWNDQIMESPAHNLEKFKDGKLVFLDNESGLFHGFRLIDKYESLHRALLDSLCIFRSSTASAIKRLAVSGSVGSELKALFQQNEPLYRHVANLPQKNIKILQSRIAQVNEQIIKCEKMFNS